MTKRAKVVRDAHPTHCRITSIQKLLGHKRLNPDGGAAKKVSGGTNRLALPRTGFSDALEYYLIPDFGVVLTAQSYCNSLEAAI